MLHHEAAAQGSELCSQDYHGLSEFEQISLGFRKLHWLPIKYRMEFSVLTMVFTWTAEIKLFIAINEWHKPTWTTIKLRHYGHRTFAVYTPWLLNILPDKVKAYLTLYILRKIWKTHFLGIVFSWTRPLKTHFINFNWTLVKTFNKQRNFY